MPPDEAAGQAEPDEDKRCRHHAECVAPHCLRGDGDREDKGADAENEHAVGDVAADDIADGDAGRTGQGGIDADHQLGKRRSESDDGKTDDERRDAEAVGKGDRAADDCFTAEQQKREACGDEQIDHRRCLPGACPITGALPEIPGDIGTSAICKGSPDTGLCRAFPERGVT